MSLSYRLSVVSSLNGETMKKKSVILFLFLLTTISLFTGCIQNPSEPSPTGLATAVQEPTLATTPTEVVLSLEPPPGFFWWNEMVFYQLFVRSFYDSDGDGIGDLNGIIEKLDYLNDGDPSTSSDLGVRGIWLLPIFPSPSYHGYDVTDYTSINPEYGTMEDFKRLLEEAHRRDMRVILDWPLNHTSSQHPWFQGSQTPDSPYRDYYIWLDEDPGYLGPWGQDPWHEGTQGGYYYGVFWSEMPDLNYTNPAVVEEMNQVAAFWLEKGVDGFRLDGARYIVEEGQNGADTPGTHAYYQQLRTMVKEINPEALLLGEVWIDNFTVSTYTQGDELDLAFDFELAKGMMTSAFTGSNQKVTNALSFNLKLFPNGQSAAFLTNHDMDRAISDLGGDIDKAKNAAAMLFSTPGVPFIYYGEEIGLAGSRGAAQDDIPRRLPMQWTGETNAGFTTGEPWTKMAPFFQAVNVAYQDAKPDSLLSFYRDWIHLRNQSPALLYGAAYLVDSTNSAIHAVLRFIEGQAMLVLVNLSDKPITNYSLRLRNGPLADRYQVTSVIGEGNFAPVQANPTGGFDDYQPLPELPPNGRYVLILDR